MKRQFGGYIRTFKNHKFFFNDIENSVIDIEDIAHALAYQSRWTGHAKQFISIAEHSILVAQNVLLYYKLEALLHDASEAYVVDLSRPLKEFVPDYRKIQKAVEAEVAKRFVVPYPMSDCVREADDRMLVTEWVKLFDKTDIELGIDLKPYTDFDFPNWSPKEAEQAFLDNYEKFILNNDYY